MQPMMFSDCIAMIRDLHQIGIAGVVLSIVIFAFLARPFRAFILDGAPWVLLACGLLSFSLSLESMAVGHGFYTLTSVVSTVLIGREVYRRLTRGWQ